MAHDVTSVCFVGTQHLMRLTMNTFCLNIELEEIEAMTPYFFIKIVLAMTIPTSFGENFVHESKALTCMQTHDWNTKSEPLETVASRRVDVCDFRWQTPVDKVAKIHR